MASIFNQDIGLNYKGIITLGSTINQNLSGTLQYLTDGDGNNLPLQVSTTGLQFNAIETIYSNAAGTNIAMNVWGNLGRVAIGGLATNYTPSAPLQVRGDALSPIARFEDNAGTLALQVQHSINGIGLLTSGSWVGYNSSTTQLVGIQGGYYYILNSTSRFQINLATNETRNLGNLFVGSVAVTSTARLHVRGDGTNPIFRAENSAGIPILTIPATTGLITTNSPIDITSAFATETIFRGSNASGALTLAVSSIPAGGAAAKIYGRFSPATANTHSTLVGSYFTTVADVALFLGNLGTGSIATSGTTGAVRIYNEFLPTSGTATNYALGILHTINQTGGANGITRGLYVAPTLTLVTDFRAYDSDITFANASGSNKLSLFNANYTINNTGTTSGSIVTGIKLNATETSITGTTHNLMDLQVGGVSKFKVDRVGTIILDGNIHSVTNDITLRQSSTAGNGGGFIVQRASNLYGAPILFMQDAVDNTFNFIDFRRGASTLMRLFSGGSLAIGHTAASARLHVRGDGTNPIARFETSAGVEQFSIGSTGNALFAQTINLDAGGAFFGASRMKVGPAGPGNNARMFVGDAGATSLMGAYGDNTGIIVIGAGTQGNMGGATSMLVNFSHGYTSAGTGNYTHVQFTNTINHTGASGISRSLYLNTTVTAAFDYRAIEVKAGSTAAHKLMLLTNAAGNKVIEVNAAQEIGLFGVAPIAQPTTAIAPAAVTTGGGAAILEDDLFAGYTVAQIAQALVTLGILKP